MMKGQKGYVLVDKPAVVSVSANLWTALWGRLARWHELHHQRQLLARLSNDALKDLGLSRADILQEVERPFWDDPLRH